MSKVLIISYFGINANQGAGVEKYVKNLSEFLIKNNIACDIAYKSSKRELHENGIGIYVENGFPFQKLLYNVKLYFQIKKQIKNKKYDFVIINGDNGGLLSLQKNVKKIFVMHGFAMDDILHSRMTLIWKSIKIILDSPLIFLELLAFRMSDYIASVSKYAVHIPENLFKRKKIYIAPPTAPPAKKFDMSEISIRKKYGFNSELICLFVGKYIVRKGLYTAMNSVDQLKNIKLLIVGPDVKPDNLNSNCVYFGTVPDETLKELYYISDILLFPSIYEGFPTVAIEAMSYGTIPMVYDMPPFNEILNNKNAIPVNSALEFREKLIMILENREMLESIKLNCINTSKNFEPENAFRPFLDIISNSNNLYTNIN